MAATVKVIEPVAPEKSRYSGEGLIDAPPVQALVAAVQRQFPKFLPAPLPDKSSQRGDPFSFGVTGLLSVPLLLALGSNPRV